MVQDRPATRRNLLIGAGTAASIVVAGCRGGEEPEDSPEDGTEDDTEPEDDDSDDGQLLEVVVRGDDESIEGATVTVDGEEGETDENGNVAFDGLEEGEYTVEAEADGFESEEEEVEVDDRGLTIYSVDLSPE